MTTGHRSTGHANVFAATVTPSRAPEPISLRRHRQAAARSTARKSEMVAFPALLITDGQTTATP